MSLFSVLYGEKGECFFSSDATAGTLHGVMLDIAAASAQHGGVLSPSTSFRGAANTYNTRNVMVDKNDVSPAVGGKSVAAGATAPASYIAVELLPLSFVHELCTNTKIASLLTNKQNGEFFLSEGGATNASPGKPSAAGAAGAAGKRTSNSTTNASATTAALSALLNNVPFVGLSLAPVRQAATALPHIGSGGKYILLGCRETCDASRTPSGEAARSIEEAKAALATALVLPRTIAVSEAAQHAISAAYQRTLSASNGAAAASGGTAGPAAAKKKKSVVTKEETGPAALSAPGTMMEPEDFPTHGNETLSTITIAQEAENEKLRQQQLKEAEAAAELAENNAAPPTNKKAAPAESKKKGKPEAKEAADSAELPVPLSKAAEQLLSSASERSPFIVNWQNATITIPKNVLTAMTASGTAAAAGNSTNGAVMTQDTIMQALAEKRHVLQRMEGFDVLWRGPDGEEEVLTNFLIEYVNMMKQKLEQVISQLSNVDASKRKK